MEKIAVNKLGQIDYATSYAAMRRFTAERTQETPDEIWLLEHPPVYTLGLAADPMHGPKTTSDIALVQADRGGEITYHGPGQLVLYTLVDLARRGIKVRQFVALLEQSVIELLGGRGETRPEARGVYLDGAKIAALGIRVSRGCTYHGLSLNVAMDLAPFEAIDPCGYPGMPVTQTSACGYDFSVASAGDALARILARRLEHA